MPSVHITAFERRSEKKKPSAKTNIDKRPAKQLLCAQRQGTPEEHCRCCCCCCCMHSKCIYKDRIHDKLLFEWILIAMHAFLIHNWRRWNWWSADRRGRMWNAWRIDKTHTENRNSKIAANQLKTHWQCGAFEFNDKLMLIAFVHYPQRIWLVLNAYRKFTSEDAKLDRP